MAYPAAIVEIAFDDGPYVANPTWTNVTQYVRRMSIDRGRSDDWGDFNGTATVVLNNRTRLFDPYYTSGTYYGKLLPRRQIRIRATTTELGVTTTHDVFRGFIDGWNPEWTDAGTDSTTTLQCFDALQLLAGEQLPADYSRPYVLSLGPRHYYPLDEPIVTGTTTTLRDLGSYPQPITALNAVSDRQLAFGLPQKSVQTTGGSSALVDASYAVDFTVSMWANYGAVTLFYIGRFRVEMYFDNSTDRYTADLYDSNTATRYRVVSTNTYDGGDPFMLTFQFSPGTFINKLFLNGTELTTTVTTSAVLINPYLEGIFVGNGQYQQILVFHSTLSADQIRTIYNLSDAIFPETTAARFTRIIGETPFPASLTSTASAPKNSVLDITSTAPPVTDELRMTATSEGGPLFVSKNGTITMFNQTQIFSQTKSIVSQVTYGHSGTKMGTQVQITADGDSMRNQAFVSMSGGGVLQKDNTSSQTTYGNASMSIDTHVQTIANADALGQIITSWGGNIYSDLTPVDVVLSADEYWKPTMDLELMDRITVNIQPPTGNTISTPMLVQRISHDVTPGMWVTTLEGSARWAAVFIINQSLLGGTDLLG